MSSALLAASGKANPGLEKVFRVSGRSLPPIAAIARVARRIWPVKTDREMSLRTGTSDRACRDLLAERGGMSLDAITSLLKSEEGIDFLEALLGDATPAWRARLHRSIKLAELRQQLEEQRQRIAELELSAANPFKR